MDENNSIQLFEDRKIRTAWDEEKEEWYFSCRCVGVLTDSVDPTAYWRKLKQRLKAEGNETVTNCHGLKMKAADGKMRLTDVLIQNNYYVSFSLSHLPRQNRSSNGWHM